MNNQTFEITIDTKKSHCHSNIEFSQNNLNISEIIFNITEDEKEFPLKDTDKIIVYFRKPDKTVVFQDKEVVLIDKAKGKIKVLLTTQTLAKSGDVHGEISIERVENGTKKRVSTYGFTFKVRSSIASNDSIESTNEFQVFDKIIKVGEKFEGVDIDGIIAAGELAKGALPKTGGTMTGQLTSVNNVPFKFKPPGKVSWLLTMNSGGGYPMFVPSKSPDGEDWDYSGAISLPSLLKKTGDTMTGNLILEGNRDLRLQNSANDVLFRNNSSGVFAFFDIAQNQVIWTYNPATKEFNVNANTNLVKKTGDTITGLMTTTDNFRFKAGGERNITWRDGNDTEYIKLYANSGGNRLGLWSTKNNKAVWEYHGDNDIFNVTANTNLVKKTGDTMTGDLNFDVSSVLKRVSAYDGSTKASSLAMTKTGSVFLEDGLRSNFNPWVYDSATQTFTVNANFKTAKDGRADLVLTADGENFNGNIGPIADRKGNTVTFRAGLRRRVGSTGPVMTTLPVNMRPTMTIMQVIPATDGTLARVTIQSNGDVQLESAGNTSIMGKDVYMSITYVVN